MGGPGPHEPDPPPPSNKGCNPSVTPSRYKQYTFVPPPRTGYNIPSVPFRSPPAPFSTPSVPLPNASVSIQYPIRDSLCTHSESIMYQNLDHFRDSNCFLGHPVPGVSKHPPLRLLGGGGVDFVPQNHPLRLRPWVFQILKIHFFIIHAEALSQILKKIWA